MITNRAALQIAAAFELLVHDVVQDARQVDTWAGSADDLLVSLERRHGWRARSALAYLLSLRSAIQCESDPDSAAG